MTIKILILINLIQFVLGLDYPKNQNLSKSHDKERIRRVLPPFQFIKFPNDGCNGGIKDGTCFTESECSGRGGVASGSCANGYGVCCIFVLGCGSTSSVNNTFLSQSETTSINSNLCEYKICQVNPAVCRVRLDFLAFNIAGPIQAINTAIGSRNEVGNCATDSFQATVLGGRSSPIICGFNTGQHMIVDVGAATCVTAIFKIATIRISRNWEIKVTQFDCGDQNGGPAGCLQYFTGVTNTFASFNFPTGDSTITQTATHLSYQNYDICIRRETGFCFICYIPTILVLAPAANNQNSFGISASSEMVTANINTNQNCNFDYLSIPAGSDRATTLSADPMAVNVNTRFCGRHFGIFPARTQSSAVCSASTPFKLTFFTDAYELSTAGANAKTNEEVLFPMGTLGFMLTYTQLPCGTTA